MASQQRRGGLLSVAGSVAGLTLVSRILGFLRWLVQAATVGTGTVAGAYTTANQLPNTLYEVVVGGVLAATVVPLLAAPIAAGRREEVATTASGLLGLVLAVLTPLSLGLTVPAGPRAAGAGGVAGAGGRAPTASATNSTAPEPSEKPLMLTAPTACPSAMVAKSASMGWLDRKFANSDMWPLHGRQACQHCELFSKIAPSKPRPAGGNRPEQGISPAWRTDR